MRYYLIQYLQNNNLLNNLELIEDCGSYWLSYNLEVSVFIKLILDGKYGSSGNKYHDFLLKGC